MEDGLASPERSAPVRKHSTRRKKRRASFVKGAGPEPDAEHSPEETKEEEEEGPEEGDDADGDYSPEKEAKDETSARKRTPKKVDVVLPGPSPTRSREEAQDAPASGKKPSSRAKRTSHSRASSIVSSNIIEPPSETESSEVPASNGKPPSSSGSRAPLSETTRMDTPDSVGDDVSVVGESSKRVRKTEAERMEFLQNDPLSGEVEAHRVFCTGCQEWVDLNPKRRYVMQNWVHHRKHCTKPAPETPEPAQVKLEEGEGEVEGDNALAAPTEKTPSLVDRTPSRGGPSKRIATAQRKLQLVNDTQVKKLKETSVECAVCRTEVSLKGDIEYDLRRWEEHKATCTRSPARALSSVGSHATLGAVDTSPATARSPPSRTSTEATAVGASPSRLGEKRGREDGEEGGGRSVRARTEVYEAAEGESAGVLDWVLLPLRSFVRGFREGLSSG